MKKFSIAQVEALTGIQAHTLRIWEKRYDFIQAKRTNTNIRYYTNDQLRKLLNLSILLRNGYKVSKFDQMGDTQIHETVAGILASQTTEEDNIQSLIMATIDLDEAAFTDTFDANVQRYGLLETITRIIYPFMIQIGILWGVDQVLPSQEHFISSLVKMKIYAAINELPIPKNPKGHIVLTLMEDEEHELGLLTSYYMLKTMGWQVFYLGQSVPIRDVQHTCQSVNADYVFTFFVTPRKHPLDILLNELHQATATPVLVSGSAHHFEKVKLPKGVTYLPTPKDLSDHLRQPHYA